MTRRRFVLLIALFLVLGVMPVGDRPSARAEATESAPGVTHDGLLHRTAAPRIDVTSIGEGYSDRLIHVKFREGSTIRLRSGGFTSLAGDDVSDLTGTSRVNTYTIRRMFSRSEGDLTAEKARLEARTGREQADKNLWYVLDLADGADPVALIAHLNGLDIVETAYPAPLAQPLPVGGDYTAEQNYQDSAVDGVDTLLAQTLPGGRGENVSVFDVEYEYNTNHEDLTNASGAQVDNGIPCGTIYGTDHGTAVMGVLFADPDTVGIRGNVYRATPGFVNAKSLTPSCTYELAAAIDVAHQNMTAGDVMVIEQQVSGGINGASITCDGTGSPNGLLAVEWVPVFYDAIAAATADGIHVIEAGGNGSCNLDEAQFGSPFPMGRPDSGAIIVGAGNAAASSSGSSPPRGRIDYSAYGDRVNVQGWGERVTTLGYGDRNGSSESNDAYTSTFSGTSSASPIVASAVAALSSIAEQAGVVYTPNQMRDLIMSTGSPQDLTGDTGHIGPLPDIAAALEDMPVKTRKDTYYVGRGGTLTTTGGIQQEIEPNHTGGPWGAQWIDGITFTTGFHPDIGNESANTSLTVPHATVIGTGDGTADWYTFDVPTGGGTVTVDIDGAFGTGGSTSFDAYVRLYDTDGTTVLTSDDDSNPLHGAGGSVAVSTTTDGAAASRDPYLVRTLGSGGVYFIEVTGYGVDSVPSGGTYQLHVSISGRTPFAETGVLGNDRYVLPPGGTMSVVAVTDGGGPDHGIVTVNPDGSFTYTHDGSTNFTDSFYYLAQTPGGAPTLGKAAIKVPKCNNKAATIAGTRFEDTMLGTAGNDVIHGMGGDDHIFAFGGSDTVCGGPGDDVIWPYTGSDTIFGEQGDDTVNFSSESGGVVVDLGAGTATGPGSIALAGIENVVGSTGNDTITGNGRENRLDGAAGDDILIGLGRADILIGGSGKDILVGGPGADLLDGRNGKDTVTYASALGPITADLATKSATGEGADTLRRIEKLIGSSGHDTLRGDGANNSLTGGFGNDYLNGRAGDDKLVGGPGGDTLNGGTGTDTGAGGAGADTCTMVEIFMPSC